MEVVGDLVRRAAARLPAAQAGKHLAQIADAAHRYDALDTLAGVCQGGTFSGETCSGGQSRTFIYSSLGRLVSATNPEKDSATTYT